MTDINWIGEIPQDWKLKRSKSLIISRDGGAWGEDEHNDETDTICIRIADFDYDKLTLKENNDYTKRNYNKSTISKLLLKKGDILVEKSGGGEKTPVGRTIMFDKDFEALFANFMDRLRVDENQVLPMFMEYLFVAMYQNDISRLYIKQTTGIQNLNLTELLDREYFPVPHMDEQVKIVDFLNCKCKNIDEILVDLNNQVEILKKYKKSVITKAVTKGLDSSVQMKDSGVEWIGEIPEHWWISKFKYLCSFHNGDRSDNYPSGNELLDAGIPFLGANNLDVGKIDYNDMRYISREKYNSLSGVKFNYGDSIYCLRGATIGKTAFCDINEGTVASSLMVIRPENLNPKYLNYYILSEYETFQRNRFINGAAAPNLSAENVGSYIIPTPNLEEQKLIANYLDDKCVKIDELIKDKQTQIEKMEKYKKSLIYEYVTGKKRVKGV